MSNRSPHLALAFTGAVLLSASSRAQTLFQLDAMPSAALVPPRLTEFNAGPGGPCGYPSGPVLDVVDVPGGGSGCGLLFPLMGSSSGWGGLSIDRYTDRIWVASDSAVLQFEFDGSDVLGFPNPLADPITGVAFDPASGRLWVSSAAEYARVIVGCGGSVIDLGPFTSPYTADLQALTWDPSTLRLWAAFDDGIVGSFGPGAAGLSCAVDVTSLGLGAELIGLDLDTRTPGAAGAGRGAFVMDSTTQVARIDLSLSCSSGTATLMPPDFAFPSSLFSALYSLSPAGLAFAARGVTYGSGLGPEIDLVGHAVPGNVVNVTLDGAAAGTAALFVDQSALCPSGTFKGLPLHVAPWILLGPVAHGGSLSVPAPLPASLPPGLEVHMQWFSKDGATGAFESTPALMFGTSRP